VVVKTGSKACQSLNIGPICWAWQIETG
jgi:hypothetical protein